MIELLHRTLLVDEAVLLLGALVLLARPRPTRWMRPGAWALQVLLVVQGVVGLARLAGGGGPPRPGLFAAYLVAACALLPLAGALAGRDDVRLGAVRLGAGTALALVVQSRLADLWVTRG